MKNLINRWAFLLLILGIASFAATAEEPTEQVPEQQLSEEQLAFYNEAYSFWESVERKTGKVVLGNGLASLDVPESFFYLNPSDSQRVLTEFWGNPAGEMPLGMLFAKDAELFGANSWGVTIAYSEEGYVSDDDADDIDYTELLSDMKQGTRDASREREAAGYESIELVGWASQPFYDKKTHKMHWAKEIKFGQDEINTLNYNIRVLGRKGVLVLNFIAGMDQFDLIQSHMDTVVAMADFNKGYTYSEFDPSMDQVAAYGIGALVTGKVLAKTGILAGLLIFLKKFGIFILVGIGGLFSKLFGRKKEG